MAGWREVGEKTANPKTTFADLFLKHPAASFDKQLYLGDMLRNHDAQFKLRTGTITFNKSLSSIQILGTESEVTDTWLWGAKEEGNISDDFMQASIGIGSSVVRDVLHLIEY
ncbi:DUF6882 domain-containing protein [Coleofasciculus sp. H7-2]|uniref:DUF6882 domain-containing protein n=1 Tax=Coleofasciculus sp. H7-2 TaxID=3351545 RepID=UPI003672F613